MLSSRWIDRIAVVAGLRLQLDDPHPSEVGADRLDVVADAGDDVGIGRPDGVLVGLALVPESTAVELAVGGGDGGEVGVAAALPVHVLEGEVLLRGNLEVGVGEATKPESSRAAIRGCAVASGICVLQWSAVGQNEVMVVSLWAGARPNPGKVSGRVSEVVVGATVVAPATVGIGGAVCPGTVGGSDSATMSSRRGMMRNCPAGMSSGLVSSLAFINACTGIE